jgi:15-cis-phytoene synthase
MSRSTSFYYSFLVLPKSQREAVIAVWDFCRAVDDTVDEAADGPLSSEADRQRVRAALAAWRVELDRVFGGAPTSREGMALARWVPVHALSRQPFADLIDGVEMDLDRARYATFDDLYEYCWRVASTVGLICLEIFGARAARDYAVNLGVALQLTNILRDVATDLRRGRIYLPLEDLNRFRVTPDALVAGRVTAEIRALLEFQAARARDYYARARAALPAASRRALIAAEIMGGIYFDLLSRIEQAGYDVFSSRIRVPRARQATLAAGTWLRLRLTRHVSA